MFSVKSMTRTAVAICGATALLGSGAQVASAAPALVNGGTPLGTAHWGQPTGQSLTIAVKPYASYAGTITYSCTIPANRFSPGNFGNSGSPLQGWVHTFRLVGLPVQCTTPGGTALLRIDGVHQQLMAEKSGTAFSLTSPVSWNVRLEASSPGAVYSTTNGASVAWSVPVINGTTGPVNPTRAVFSNTVIGNVGPGATPMSLTGTLNLLNVQLS